MQVRRAIKQDLDAINHLMESSSAYDGEYRKILQGYSVTEQQLLNDHIFVAVSDTEILGFYSLVAEKRELDLMFVSDNAQGGGAGAALFNHMADLAYELKISTVRIISHPPAEKFYKRMGARRIDTLPSNGNVTWARPILEYSIHSHA